MIDNRLGKYFSSNSSSPLKNVRVFILHFRQDDPRKCTANRLIQRGLAKRLSGLRSIPFGALVLNPFSEDIFFSGDAEHLARGLVGVDCSWRKAEELFQRRFRGVNRRLPLLLPVNPVNYGHLGVLSSVEALAAALAVGGFMNEAQEILRWFKWGLHFLELNREPLADYAAARSVEEVKKLEREYFGEPSRKTGLV